jgi:hypothetical protein
LSVLNKNNSNGFVLMVEGASIDKQAHLMDTDRWILETIEFDRAIQKAKDFATANPDTIVLVTADHECSGAAIIGASTATAATLNSIAAGLTHTTAAQRDAVVGTYDSAKFPKYTIAADGYPISTDIDGKIMIGYGANADRYETWLTNAQPSQDSQQPFIGAAPLNAYTCGANNLAGTQCTSAANTGAVRNSTTGYLVTGQVPSGHTYRHRHPPVSLRSRRITVHRRVRQHRRVLQARPDRHWRRQVIAHTTQEYPHEQALFAWCRDGRGPGFGQRPCPRRHRNQYDTEFRYRRLGHQGQRLPGQPGAERRDVLWQWRCRA